MKLLLLSAGFFSSYLLPHWFAVATCNEKKKALALNGNSGVFSWCRLHHIDWSQLWCDFQEVLQRDERKRAGQEIKLWTTGVSNTTPLTCILHCLLSSLLVYCTTSMCTYYLYTTVSVVPLAYCCTYNYVLNGFESPSQAHSIASNPLSQSLSHLWIYGLV